MPKARKQIVLKVTQKKKGSRRGASAPRQRSTSKNVIKNLSSAIGGIALGPIGARIGANAGSFIAHIMGQGDYKVEKNTLMTNSGPPSFSTNGDDVIIKHRELVNDLSSSISFVNNNYLINPGNTTLFPWLSQIANSFEEYEFLGLIAEFKSTSGSAIASTNNALGTVIIATDYNVENTLMSNKRSMETTEFSTSSGTDTTFIHPVECSKARNVLPRQYVSTATTIGAVAGDPRFYFLGNLQVATVGQQASGVNIGEVWVSYQVRLSRPVGHGLSEDPIMELPSAHIEYRLASGNNFPAVSTQIAGLPRFIDLTAVPAIPFYPPDYNTFASITGDYDKSLFSLYPAGEYLITARYNMQGLSSSTVTFASNWVNSNAPYPTALVTILTDATLNTASRSSAMVLMDPTGTRSGEWNGVATIRVQWKPDLWLDKNSFPNIIIPSITFTGSGVSTVDVSWSYIPILRNIKDYFISDSLSNSTVKVPSLTTNIITRDSVDYEYVPTPRKF